MSLGYVKCWKSWTSAESVDFSKSRAVMENPIDRSMDHKRLSKVVFLDFKTNEPGTRKRVHRAHTSKMLEIVDNSWTPSKSSLPLVPSDEVVMVAWPNGCSIRSCFLRFNPILYKTQKSTFWIVENSWTNRGHSWTRWTTNLPTLVGDNIKLSDILTGFGS